jgi:hypothetical protein
MERHMPIDLPPPPAIVITNDGGGIVKQYKKLVDLYSMENRQVRIMGSCRSACILYLGAKNVCVGPNAIIKAHMAYEPVSGMSRPDVTSEMMDMIPYSVSSRLSPYITVNYNEKTTLNYNQLVELGIKKCKSDVVSASDKPKQQKEFRVGKPTPGDPITKFLFDNLGVN